LNNPPALAISDVIGIIGNKETKSSSNLKYEPEGMAYQIQGHVEYRGKIR
jgi:hypothetical protein